MSISPAQSVLELATMGPLARVSAGGASPDRQPAAEPAPAAPAEPSGPTLSTALRIDDQRRIYYEVINNRSGDVVMEIPPEQIRKPAEGLDESLKRQPDGHNIDVKS